MNFNNYLVVKLDTVGNHHYTAKLNKTDFDMGNLPYRITNYGNIIYFISYKENKGTFVCEVDLINGTLPKKHTIKRTTPSINNIVIHENTVYYLSRYDTWRTGLFKEELEFKTVASY